MKCISKQSILIAIAIAAMLVATTIVPVGAQLAPVGFAMPSVFQNSQVTAFSRDTATAQDLESLNVNFGPACGLGIGFPSISQTVDKTYVADHTDFYHAEQTAAFNAPFVSVGPTGGLCVPGGLGGLGGLGIPAGFC